MAEPPVPENTDPGARALDSAYAGEIYEINIRLSKDVLEAYMQNCFEADMAKSQVAERALKAYLGIK